MKSLVILYILVTVMYIRSLIGAISMILRADDEIDVLRPKMFIRTRFHLPDFSSLQRVAGSQNNYK